MIRNMAKVLDLWGAWAASDRCDVDYSPIAAGFKNLLPSTRKACVSCSDDDGLAISGVITLLKKKDAYLYRLLELYYVKRITLRVIAIKLGISLNQVVIRMQKAEGFVEGCLAALNISLEMDC